MKTTEVRLHLAGLAPKAARAVKAAIAYAEKNQTQREQSMSLPEFCDLVGLPTTTPRTNLVTLVSKARRATASARVVDDSTGKKKELLTGSWAVFNSVFITGTSITFEVCPYMWQDLTTHV